MAPNSDSVDEYVNQCPTRFVVPLKDCLFRQQLSNDANAATASSSRIAEISAPDVNDSTIRYRAEPSIKCGSQKLLNVKRRVSKTINLINSDVFIQLRMWNIPAVQAYDTSTGRDIITQSTVSVTNKQKRKGNEVDMGEVTEDDDASNWIRLRTLGKHHVKKMGDPVQCISATFNVSRKHFKKFEFHESLDVGKISGIYKYLYMPLSYWRLSSDSSVLLYADRCCNGSRHWCEIF